jgi:hypothetical protein
MDLDVCGNWIYIYTNPSLSFSDPSTNRHTAVVALPYTAVCGVRFDDKAFEISLYAHGHMTPIYCIFKSGVEYLVAKNGLVLLLQEYGLAPKAVFHTISNPQMSE